MLKKHFLLQSACDLPGVFGQDFHEGSEQVLPLVHLLGVGPLRDGFVVLLQLGLMGLEECHGLLFRREALEGCFLVEDVQEDLHLFLEGEDSVSVLLFRQHKLLKALVLQSHLVVTAFLRFTRTLALTPPFFHSCLIGFFIFATWLFRLFFDSPWRFPARGWVC